MIELREVEEEIDNSYKERRSKEESDAIKTMKHNPKFFFSYAKRFSKTDSEIAAFEKEDGELTTDPADQAEILMKQYNSVASEPNKEESDCIHCKEEKVQECNEDLPEDEFKSGLQLSSSDLVFSETDVSECINMLSPCSAAGPDGLPAAMLKGTKTTFAKMITDILRSSLDTGDIPNILKLAHITPIHKGGSRAEPVNFRPVSLISHLMKTMERVIRKALVGYLEYHEMMDTHQHGSRSGRSTLLQLLEHQDQVIQALEERYNLDTIYLDFLKAFDKCDFGILLNKIKKMGIKGKIGRWIQSFLHQRQQRVVVNKRMSTASVLKSGVPQGSVLGPVLFLIYICDIGKDLTASTLVYVDDTKVKKTVKTEEDVEELQLELEKLNNWSENNNMEFNKKKFQVIRYGENEDLKNETLYFAGNYDEVIERFTSLRDL